MSYGDLPIVYIVDLGGEEFVGLRDTEGNFQEVASLRNVPDTEYAQVEMFGPSLGLIVPCSIDILDQQGSAIAKMTIRVTNKKVGCRSIFAGPNYELTGTLLRQVPFARLIREAALANTVRVLETEDGITFGARYVEGGPGLGSLHSDLRRELATVGDRGRRRVIDDAFLQRVAGVYRDAIIQGYPPARAVEELLGPTTPTNARRWIAAARADGFLGPAPARGRAGELAHVENTSS